MLCEECGKRQAVVHFTKIINHNKEEKHLCEQCAKEKGEIEMSIEPKFSLHNLLASLLNPEISSVTSPGSMPSIGQKCSSCGLSYNQISQLGKLGCSKCYTQFQTSLDPLLRRIHGSTRHTGKIPKRSGEKIQRMQQLAKMREELQIAIQREAFEMAAELRDKIKAMEKEIDIDQNA